MGIHSLKIEGRTKSHYYASRTVQSYRQAIDVAVGHKPFNPKLMHQLDNLSNRGYTEGFYRRHTHDSYQHYSEGHSTSDHQQVVAEVTGVDENGRLQLRVKNKFHAGDRVELMTPAGNLDFHLEDIRSMNNGEPLMVVPGSDHQVSMPLALGVDLGKADFGLLMRWLP